MGWVVCRYRSIGWGDEKNGVMSFYSFGIFCIREDYVKVHKKEYSLVPSFRS